MSLKTVKRVVSRLEKTGVSRVRIMDVKAAESALTADDIRALLKSGAVVVIPETGTGRGKARIRDIRRKAGRGRGEGSRHGTPSAVLTDKKRWMRRVRALRRLLKSLKSSLALGDYKRLYRMVKGGSVRDKKQLVEYAKAGNAAEGAKK
jgi:large subunit ribosomal protein L19e